MRRPGFALIAVFWIVMVVGLFAAIVASRTGFDLDRGGWALGMGKARAAADGAVEEAAFQLVGRIGMRTRNNANAATMRPVLYFSLPVAPCR